MVSGCPVLLSQFPPLEELSYELNNYIWTGSLGEICFFFFMWFFWSALTLASPGWPWTPDLLASAFESWASIASAWKIWHRLIFKFFSFLLLFPSKNCFCEHYFPLFWTFFHKAASLFMIKGPMANVIQKYEIGIFRSDTFNCMLYLCESSLCPHMQDVYIPIPIVS